ncbi:glycine oxidase ThiO [Psychrosphaera saromensis]|uniref:D-amino-acid oxidase n=1 Tax=Psychrosphaera saromensis TaxID=716813 RepID=A0A2S7UTK4_9GAMM|nr:FAD-dependent oxidoreductase [Psychrosphaera saromensis]PQJ53304.1 oxidoreductase [Psychrosphaera saromensis]GHB66543.1 glycine oxidase ThiO [Psychrosphaera saromensis]GLQ14928.1 glycine oxidase ThiO [Psychrosphaera saromensis]
MKIAVVGAGLIGRLSALSLTRQGYQVSLFDKDSKQARQSAAYAAGGLLTPLGESMSCEPNIVAMGFSALKKWPELLATLEDKVYFQQQGAIMVSHEQDKGDYQRFAQHLSRRYPQHTAQSLNRQQLTELEPELAHNFSQGLFLPDEGQIDNRMLLTALQKQLELEQVNWFAGAKVTQINNQPGHCQLTVNEQVHTFDLVIDCRGVGARTDPAQHSNLQSDQHFTEKSMALTDLRAVRGELFHLFAPEVNLTRPVRLMHPRYQLYIAPKPNHVYVVGATEIESDDLSPMTVRSAMELLSAAYSVNAGFAEANIREHISQLRPAFSDNQPQVLVDGRLIQVNGLYRHGFLISPVVLEQVELAVLALDKSSELQLKQNEKTGTGAQI